MQIAPLECSSKRSKAAGNPDGFPRIFGRFDGRFSKQDVRWELCGVALGYRVAYFNGIVDEYFDEELFDAVASGADAVILWYLYKTDSNIFGIGGHFVEFWSVSAGYAAYNAFSNSNSAYLFSSPSAFAFQCGSFYMVVICIYKDGD